MTNQYTGISYVQLYVPTCTYMYSGAPKMRKVANIAVIFRKVSFLVLNNGFDTKRCGKSHIEMGFFSHEQL